MNQAVLFLLEFSSNPPTMPDFSTGFWARNSKNQLGIVTAFHGTGHVGQAVYAYTFEDPDSDAPPKKVYFGSVTQEVFDGSVDATFVRRGDARFTPLTYVDGWDFNLKSQTQDMKVGDMIYKKGAASGITRGTALETSFNPTKYADTNLSDAVLVECIASPGDSGGIVAGGGTTASRYVVGIISGGGTYIKDGKRINAMYYSRASDILNTLNLTLY